MTTYQAPNHSEVEQGRYNTLLNTLQTLRPYFTNKKVLDFGASSGLSAKALIECGATRVVGVEPERERVEQGHQDLSSYAKRDAINLVWVPDTRDLCICADKEFDVVFANAVFEHIPQPRHEYIKEIWRVLAPGGYLIINETPNKYLPADFHTLHLPLTNWLPSQLAHWIGVATKRFKADRTDWAYSGWRGLGYYELVRAIPGIFAQVPELVNGRQRLLHKLGLPSNLIDPYPLYIIQKVC